MKRAIYTLCTIVLLLCARVAAQTKNTARAAKPAASATTTQTVDPLQGSPKIISATKGVTQFWDIENQLAQAFANKDKAALDKMLPEEFRVEIPNQTGSAVSRGDWLAAGKDNPRPWRLPQMSVQFYPDLAIVHFIGIGEAPAGAGAKAKTGGKQYFVTDVWELHDGNWQLSTRYMAEINPIVMPSRPTGKE